MKIVEKRSFSGNDGRKDVWVMEMLWFLWEIDENMKRKNTPFIFQPTVFGRFSSLLDYIEQFVRQWKFNLDY